MPRIPDDARPLRLRVVEAEETEAIASEQLIRMVEMRNQNPDYVRMVNSKIALAEAWADAAVGPAPDVGDLRKDGGKLDPRWQVWADRWNRAYHARMDRLCGRRSKELHRLGMLQ